MPKPMEAHKFARELEQQGFVLVPNRGRGSHRLYMHPAVPDNKQDHVVVPMGNRDCIAPGTYNSLCKTRDATLAALAEIQAAAAAAAQIALAEPDVVEPEVPEPEVAEPEMAEPEAAELAVAAEPDLG